MTNEKELTHIDLFSGIGGFTLAAEWAGFKTIVFCEKEKFCQKVLKKHWPEIPIIEEIRDLNGKEYRGATLLTGGFPCQPFSVAGQRRGKEDDRYLWPEMRGVISEARPHWILAENVPGIFHVALDTVLADLEGQGYTTGTFIIPACGLNAPHRRNRVWIVAHCDKKRLEGTISKGKTRPERCLTKSYDDAPDSEFKRSVSGKHQNRTRPEEGIFEGNNSNTSDSEIRRIQRRSISIRQRQSQKATCDIERNRQDAPDFDSGRTRRHESKSIEKGSTSRSSWQENWYEVAAKFCRVDDGVSDRVHRLKALGNAIVPQIAYEILKNIVWIENNGI